MARIKLSTGRYAYIDDEDFYAVSYIHWTESDGYAVGAHGGPRLHRLVMGEPPGQVDHIDGDRMNCRKSNLRVATKAQNAKNRGVNRDSRSGIKGVSFYARSGRWRARIAVDGRKLFLGYFESPELAAAAYEAASEKYHGEFRRKS